MEIKYPAIEKIEELNVLVLAFIKVKKSDKPELLSKSKLQDALTQCMHSKGDIYEKAAVLLKELVQKHPFASGNRRTALVVTRYFLKLNGANWRIDTLPDQFKVLIGIRESYYTLEEIKEWIKHGQIREFKR